VSSFFGAAAPVVAVLTYGTLPSLVSLAACLVPAVIFLAVVITVRKRWKEVFNPKLVPYIAGIVFFIGVLYYGIWYVGLSLTTPGNVSIITLSEVLTSFLFFNIFRKELFSRSYMLGAFLMLLGAGIVLFSNYDGTHRGDILIFVATLFPPIGNYFQQKARDIASSETILFLRNLFTIPVIVALALLLGMPIVLGDIYKMWPLLVLNGVLVFGISKVLWVEAIHRISVTKASALASLAPLLTMLFAWILLKQEPTIWQLASFVPFFLGVLLLTGHLKLHSRPKNTLV